MEDLKEYALKINEKNELKVYANSSISDGIIQDVFDCKKFKEWIGRVKFDELIVKKLTILNVYMFGKLVGFVDMVLDCALKSHPEKRLPGYVFLRGDAVGILVIVNDEYLLLTKQFRVPLGDYSIEIPAGMIDESGDFSGIAAKEIEEETSIKINTKDLIKLDNFRPSIGGCDEQIMLFYTKITITDKEIETLKSKIHGESHEVISLCFEKFTLDNVMKTKDSKLICAAFMYQAMSGKSIPSF